MIREIMRNTGPVCFESPVTHVQGFWVAEYAFMRSCCDRMSVQASFTLIELFLDVVLVRLVPTDTVQPFCRQTCKHKPPSVQF